MRKTARRGNPCTGQPQQRRSPAAAARPAVHSRAAPAHATQAPDKRKNVGLYSTLEAQDEAHGPGELHRKPEVLAPAGGWEQLRAAVENGADAVYCGITSFNARARANNFEPEILPEVVRYCHDRDVRVYVTLNVLLFDSELQALEAAVRAIARAGVDSVIVQDVGVVELVRRVAPNLVIHASTQMSITSGEGAEFARALGCKRVVVGRELSVSEIAATVAHTQAEVEVFVHGALCVSYSGQCFSSEAWGGRSANRGQCAQACRLPYGLLVDGVLKDMGDVQYLLSPQDLMAIEHLPDLIRAGVACFKIEGRLKGPEYVALATRSYRQATDEAWHRVTSGADSGEDLLPADARMDLRQVFSRAQDEQHEGLTPGFLLGPRHQRFVRGLNPRHRGICLGRIDHIEQDVAVLRTLAAPLRVGDGVVFAGGQQEDAEEGGYVTKLWNLPHPGASVREGRVSDAVAAGCDCAVAVKSANMRRLRRGDLVWRSKDAQLEGRVRSSFDKVTTLSARRVEVDVRLRGSIGSTLHMSLQDDSGHTVSALSEHTIEAASRSPAELPSIRKALGATLGADTSFRLRHVDCSELDLDSNMFIRMSDVKATRRECVEQLLELRRVPASAQGLAEGPVAPEVIRQRSSTSVGKEASSHLDLGADTQEPKVRLLCRTRAQVDAALSVPWLEEIMLDFLEVHGLKEAVADVRAASKAAVVATPRVLKPDEQRMWRFYLSLQADGLLLRSTGLLQQLMDMGGPGAWVDGLNVTIPPLLGDFSLNVANTISAQMFMERALSRLTPTHDLNAAQLAALARSLAAPSAAKLEVVLHQHLPIFHTEHCVFCRFLSDGNSYKDCGHPCEKANVHLRDSQGQDHLVLADMGCRNTVFNARAQSAVKSLDSLLDAGIRNFRLELVDEPAHVVCDLLHAYHGAVNGTLAPSEVWAMLQTLPDVNGNVYGCEEGSLAVRAELPSSSMKETAAVKRSRDRL